MWPCPLHWGNLCCYYYCYCCSVSQLMRNFPYTSARPESPCHSLNSEPHTVDSALDYSTDWKYSPMMDMKRKFLLSRVSVSWSAKVAQEKHFPGSWSYCECFRCCAVIRGNSSRDPDVSSMSSAAPRIDCQCLWSLGACFYYIFAFNALVMKVWVCRFTVKVNENPILCSMTKISVFFCGGEEKETICLQRWHFAKTQDDKKQETKR